MQSSGSECWLSLYVYTISMVKGNLIQSRKVHISIEIRDEQHGCKYNTYVFSLTLSGIKIRHQDIQYNDIQHNDTQHNVIRSRGFFMLTVTNKPFMMSVIMLNVIMLSVVLLNVIKISAVMVNFIKLIVI